MTYNSLSVAIIQTDLVWEHPEANRAQLYDKIIALNNVDLIILPEMFTSGFTMNAQAVAESMDGKTVLWMQNLAARTQTAITGSVVIKDNTYFYNRLLFVTPNGAITWYDKHHTFTLAGEHNVYTAGSKRVLLTYKGWRICPLICYDLRFPVWSRNTENYDVLLYVANWPKVRVNAWNTLLKARAVENMCYCIGVNRTGIDGMGHEYTGHSAAYDVLGNALNNSSKTNQYTQIITLDKVALTNYREKLGFLKDRDRFILN